MACSRSLLSEDQFLCSICLDVFVDPVSTPCGHNFCMACLNKCLIQNCQCPFCMTKFPKRPELCVNTFISGLVLQFKESYQAKPSGCLEKPPTKADHKSHNTLPRDQENRERKAQIKRTQAHIKKRVQIKMKNIEEVKHDVEVFNTLRRSMERIQAEVLKVLEERQKVAELWGEQLVKELEREITDLKARDAELEQLSHTEDNIHLVQNYPGTTLSTLPHINYSAILNGNTYWAKECLRGALFTIQKLVTKTMDRIPENCFEDTLEQQQQTRTHTVVPDLKTQSAEIKQLLKSPLLEGDLWYLVDTHWFKQWEKYVGFDSEIGDQAPGPVDNSGLLKEDSLSIKDHLIDELDYVLLPTEAWLKLICWYGLAEGQKPIDRKVIKQGMFVKHLKVEVYLTELRLCECSDLRYQITRFFSKTDTIAAVEREMRGLFGIPGEKDARLWCEYMCNSFTCLDKLDETIQNAGLFKGQLLIIQQKNDYGTWS